MLDEIRVRAWNQGFCFKILQWVYRIFDWVFWVMINGTGCTTRKSVKLSQLAWRLPATFLILIIGQCEHVFHVQHFRGRNIQQANHDAWQVKISPHILPGVGLKLAKGCFWRRGVKSAFASFTPEWIRRVEYSSSVTPVPRTFVYPSSTIFTSNMKQVQYDCCPYAKNKIS